MGKRRWYFGAVLELVVILGRHGVRSPLQTPQALAPYAAQAWPQWPVAPGILTEHGARDMEIMGKYYRARYTGDGLLSGDPARDGAVLTVRCDSDQRTIESAQRLAAAIAPGHPPAVLSRPVDVLDPLFSAVRVGLGPPDPRRAAAEVLGRMGNRPDAVVRAYGTAYAHLQRALFGNAAPAPGKQPFLEMPAEIGPGEASNIVTLTGPFRYGMMLTDALLLEYAQGMPREQVGWGQVGPRELTEFLALHSLYFELTQKSLYCAQAQGSNLAAHLIETLDQSARGTPVAGAVGRPGQKLVILLGHDTNLINLAGLLDLSWILPGTARDPVLPGGGLVMELRKGDDGAQRIRIFYLAQSLDDLRNETPLTAAHPPQVAPIFIPGCSEPTPGYDAPLDAFEARLKQAIDPRFVVPESS